MSETAINTSKITAPGNDFEKTILKTQPDTVIPRKIVKIESGIGNVSKREHAEAKSESTKALEKGPLESMFPCSESRILDFLIAFQDYDYSISDIAENSGVGFKTTLGVIKNLESQKIIVNTRNVGRAKMYKINLDSEEANNVNKLALGIAAVRAENQMQQVPF